MQLQPPSGRFRELGKQGLEGGGWKTEETMMLGTCLRSSTWCPLQGFRDNILQDLQDVGSSHFTPSNTDHLMISN